MASNRISDDGLWTPLEDPAAKVHQVPVRRRRQERFKKKLKISISLHVDRLEVKGGCACKGAACKGGSTSTASTPLIPPAPPGPESWRDRLMRYGRALGPVFSGFLSFLMFCAGRVGIGIRGEDLYALFRGHRL